MFVSPVIYATKDNSGIIGIIAKYNPMTYLLDLPRTLFFYGKVYFLNEYLIFSLISFFILIEGMRFFNISINKITERI